MIIIQAMIYKYYILGCACLMAYLQFRGMGHTDWTKQEIQCLP